MTCGRSARINRTSRSTASSSGAFAKLSGSMVDVGVGHARSRGSRAGARRRIRSRRRWPRARACAPRTGSARTSGVSIAGLRMSPASPPVQHTSTVWTPSSWYRATVALPFDASSSGCACTVRTASGLPVAVDGPIAAARDDRDRREPSPKVTLSARRATDTVDPCRAAERSRCSARCSVSPSCSSRHRCRRVPVPPDDAGHPSLLRWRSCGRAFECTTLRVPIDYDHRKAGDTPITVIRRPADEPDRRIGSLVINYGGPGDPGAETLRAAAASVPAAIRHRFDLVSFDPRGTGRSHPVDCVDDATFERAWADDRTPDSRDELPELLRRDRGIRGSRGRVHPSQRALAHARRHAERGTRPGSAAHRARRGPPHVPRLLVRHGARCRVRTAVPRPGSGDGARLARRSLVDDGGAAARERRRLRARARRVPRRLCGTTRSARSTRDGDPRACARRAPRPASRAESASRRLRSGRSAAPSSTSAC